MVSYAGVTSWSDTAGAFDYTNDYAPHENYVTNEPLPWGTITSVPYQFVIDLETRTVLGKDTPVAQLSAGQILALVQGNNE
jgi:hypothetical protein